MHTCKYTVSKVVSATTELLLHLSLITSHGGRSKNLKKVDSHPVRSKKLENHVEMAESDTLQSVVMQEAIQPAMAMVTAMRESDARHISGTQTTSVGEACKQKTRQASAETTTL